MSDEQADQTSAAIPTPEETAAAFMADDPKDLVAPAPAKKMISIADTPVTSFLDPHIYLQMKVMANDFVKSKAIPKGWETAEQVLVAMQTGFEMGMKPMQSLMSLYPVNGQINIWGKATMRQLRAHGFELSYKDETADSCTAEIKRRKPGTQNAWEIYTETYTYAEASASGYTTDSYGKDRIGWKPGINRKLKLRYGVLSLIIKSYVPEVLGEAAGIVEVEEDFVPEGDTPATNKDKMLAAETRRKELDNGKHTPTAVAPSADADQPTPSV